MMITIFLADDHTVVRDGLRLILENQPDLTVVGEAATGYEAVRLVRQQCPQVVIMDITMPELNGIEAARQIREQCPTTHIVFLSMHANPQYIFRALEVGAKGYLLKGAASTELTEAVRTVCGGRRYLSEKISQQVFELFADSEQSFEHEDPLEHLSPREREVLQLVAEGKSSAEIAELLYLSPKTIDTYRSRLMRKLDLNDVASLVKFAIQQGLTPLD